jgi:hypothetical protein
MTLENGEDETVMIEIQYESPEAGNHEGTFGQSKTLTFRTRNLFMETRKFSGFRHKYPYCWKRVFRWTASMYTDVQCTIITDGLHVEFSH